MIRGGDITEGIYIMQLFLFLALIITICFAFLAIQNPGLITIQFVKWSFSGSLAFVLAIAFFSGVLAGVFILVPTLWRRAKTGRAQRKRIQELERELVSSTDNRQQPID
jgi:uncharacterized integral membrane protein